MKASLFGFNLLLVAFVMCGCADDASDDGDQPTDGDSSIIDGDEQTDGDEDGEVSVFKRKRTLILEEGGFQFGYHGEDLESLVIRLVDQHGRPVVSEIVSCRIQTGKGLSSADDIALSSPMKTDEEGRATCDATIGQKSGLALITIEENGNYAVPLTTHTWAFHPKDATHSPLIVLEINDFHMRMEPFDMGSFTIGGLSRIATIFKTVRENAEAKGVAVIITNGGDDFENTLYHNVPGVIPGLYQLYDAMGMDIIQVGNHDYHFGVPFLDEQIKEAEKGFTGERQGHPMLFTWGNVDPATLKPDYAQFGKHFETDFSNIDNSVRYNQSVIFEEDGLKIGVLGVCTDAAIYTKVAGDPFFFKMMGVPMETSQGMTFIDPHPEKSQYISDGIDSLDAEGAHTIIVLSHAGLGFGDRVNIPPGKDEFIARHGIGEESGRAVDLLLSAHSHVQLNHAIEVENPTGGVTPLVQAREAGMFVAAVSMEINTESKESNITDYHLVQVNESISEDDQTMSAVNKMRENLITEYGQVFSNIIGGISIDLSHRQRAQSGLGQILADAFFWGLQEADVKVDSALVVPSIFRADLVKGKITESEAYDIVPLHILDDKGVNDEPLVFIEMRSGLYDFSIFGVEESKREGITATEYVLETVYSIAEVIDQISPGASAEFNLEVIQLSEVSFKVDFTGPVFERIVPSSITIGGKPVDPKRPYRIAMVHSLGESLGYIFNFLVQAKNVDTGEIVEPLQVYDEKPFVETEVKGWKALRDYIETHFGKDDSYIPKNAKITGERLRSVQPDLTVNPDDIVFSNASPVRGNNVEIMITIRNLGDVSVDSAIVDVYYESTPWDLTDDDDGSLHLEGFSSDFHGSLKLIESKTIVLEKYPAIAETKVSWNIPENLPPFDYPIVVRIHDIETHDVDQNTDEAYTETILGNNNGLDQSRRLMVLSSH